MILAAAIAATVSAIAVGGTIILLVAAAEILHAVTLTAVAIIPGISIGTVPAELVVSLGRPGGVWIAALVIALIVALMISLIISLGIFARITAALQTSGRAVLMRAPVSLRIGILAG